MNFLIYPAFLDDPVLLKKIHVLYEITAKIRLQKIHYTTSHEVHSKIVDG